MEEGGEGFLLLGRREKSSEGIPREDGHVGGEVDGYECHKKEKKKRRIEE